MSLSSNNTPPQDSVKFPQFTVSAIPSVPSPNSKAPQSAEPTPQKSAPSKKKHEAAPAKAKIKWMDVTLDTLLVCLVAGVLGGGGYYLKTQWDKYRVPSIMEVTYQESSDLCAKRDELQEAYNHADEQLLMRQSIAKLEADLRKNAEKAARLRESISEQQNRVLALQHEIRRTDKEARGVARGLLPGLPVGTVTTTRGKSYTNATISRLRGNSISISTPYGAATLKISDIVKDKLPEIVLYALGEIDLVDTSDFTSTGTVPTTTKKTNPKLRNTPRSKKAPVSYEPDQPAPVVNTHAGTPAGGAGTSTPSAPSTPAGNVWQAPTGDLPL